MGHTLTSLQLAALGLCGSLFMVGCAAAPSPETVAYNSKWAKCEAIKEVVARATCGNAVIDQYVRPYDPNPDLVAIDEAQHLSLAEKVAAGTITSADASLAYAQSRSNNISEAQRRANNAEMATAAAMGPPPVTCHSYGSGDGLTTNCY